MATVYPLPELREMIRNVITKSRTCSTLIREVERLERLAGSGGIADFPIDDDANAIMAALSSLRTDINNVLPSTIDQYPYQVKTGRPVSLTRLAIDYAIEGGGAQLPAVLANTGTPFSKVIVADCLRMTLKHKSLPGLGGTTTYYTGESDYTGVYVSSIRGTSLFLTALNHIANGTFASSSYWSCGAGWAIAAGVATATASSDYLTQSGASMYYPLRKGCVYGCLFTVSGFTGGTVDLHIGGESSIEDADADGVWFLSAVCDADDADFSLHATAFTGSIDNVVLFPIINQHINNGSFLGKGNWTLGTHWQYDAVHFWMEDDGNPISANLKQPGGTVATRDRGSLVREFEVGKTYSVTITCTVTAGTLTPKIGAGIGAVISATGTHICNIVAAASGGVIDFILTGTAFQGTVTRIWVREEAEDTYTNLILELSGR